MSKNKARNGGLKGGRSRNGTNGVLWVPASPNHPDLHRSTSVPNTLLKFVFFCTSLNWLMSLSINKSPWQRSIIFLQSGGARQRYLLWYAPVLCFCDNDLSPRTHEVLCWWPKMGYLFYLEFVVLISSKWLGPQGVSHLWQGDIVSGYSFKITSFQGQKRKTCFQKCRLQTNEKTQLNVHFARQRLSSM